MPKNSYSINIISTNSLTTQNSISVDSSQEQANYDSFSQTPNNALINNGRPEPPLKNVGGLSRPAPNSLGSQLSFHDIKYTITVKNSFCKKAEKKEILHGLTGLFKPGMNAIMGPTGCGKTTLLNILAGRADVQKLDGCVLVDGMKQPSNFRCMAGFVAQDDIVMGTLTVRENFMFSANLRLPKSISKEEKIRKVDNAIYELGLTQCADSRVGTDLIRGVSGGERKRTNIGMELVISPKVLFLDEPTTGLDSSTAFAVMSLLNVSKWNYFDIFSRISKNGRTIIFSIHQPRYNIFKLFDGMLLLGAGRTIYHGPASETLQYFNSIGYECEEHENPSDFFLDVTNGDSTAVKALFKSSDKKEGPDTDHHVTVPGKSLIFTLAEEFSKSSLADKVYKEANAIHQMYITKRASGDKMKYPVVLYATSFVTQLYYVSLRAIKNIIRNPSALMLQITIMFFFGLFVGLLFFKLGTDIRGAIQNRTGAFFFIIMNQVFGNLSSIELFIKERRIFLHECSGGFYRVSAYFFAKYLCDLFPMRIIPLTCFCVIAYFMVGFQMDVAKFFIFYLSYCLTTTSASTIGFAVSSSTKTFQVAHLTTTFIFVFMQVFGGFLANVTTMPNWLSWMQYLSIVRYSLNALSINELKDLVLYQKNGSAISDAGEEYLASQGIRYETAWDLWQNEMAMAVISVGMLTIAYIQLLRSSKIR
ncbi:hypothetical protein HELRODRAFT_192026 [Helobdella robusta]|uniref:ABC transporter domain-containing protein n=1 Tax=Helobdella robusta TaxID=6412 RepID=T1FTI5_HELRO|nr:hypothetical protein HELRODRAFT_192026 [Helobdella robusta]ESO03400.1 hypothetical protein HELRODRAFT_192026 [Helobdella robusta]